jgi:hypothetical protein
MLVLGKENGASEVELIEKNNNALTRLEGKRDLTIDAEESEEKKV